MRGVAGAMFGANIQGGNVMTAFDAGKEAANIGSESRCLGITQTGARCSLFALPGKRYCRMHWSSSDERPRVFISYSHADRVFVDKLSETLQDGGVDVWIDKWMIQVGDSITQKINDGIGNSDFLIVVLSRASVRSKWVREELNTALIRNVEQDKHAFILPVLIEDCDMPTLLQHRKYADFRDDSAQALQELLAVIRGTKEKAGDEGREEAARKQQARWADRHS